MHSRKSSDKTFPSLYVDLHQDLHNGISNIFLFKEQAANSLKDWFGEKRYDLSGPLGAISSALSSRVEPPDVSKFFTEKYQFEISKRINMFRKIRFPDHVCDNWLMTFAVLGRFIQGANNVFVSYRPSSLATSTNGGVKVDPSMQASMLKNLWFSLGKLESLFAKVDDDLDSSYEHVFFKEKRIESFESRIDFDDIIKTMVVLKRYGFFSSREDKYYEAELGKEAMGLIKDFLSFE